MIQNDDLAFLARLLAGQTEEDPRVRPIAPQRLSVLAEHPSAMTENEMAALLLSPLNRAALAAAPRAPMAPANDNRYVLRPASFAADDGRVDQIMLEAPYGTLDVRPGPDSDVPYVLVLHLDPATPGGVATRRVQVWETQSGQIWIDGLTDEAGILHAPWLLGAERPRHRLDETGTLYFELGEEPSQ